MYFSGNLSKLPEYSSNFVKKKISEIVYVRIFQVVLICCCFFFILLDQYFTSLSFQYNKV